MKAYILAAAHMKYKVKLCLPLRREILRLLVRSWGIYFCVLNDIPMLEPGDVISPLHVKVALRRRSARCLAQMLKLGIGPKSLKDDVDEFLPNCFRYFLDLLSTGNLYSGIFDLVLATQRFEPYCNVRRICRYAKKDTYKIQLLRLITDSDLPRETKLQLITRYL